MQHCEDEGKYTLNTLICMLIPWSPTCKKLLAVYVQTNTNADVLTNSMGPGNILLERLNKLKMKIQILKIH